MGLLFLEVLGPFAQVPRAPLKPFQHYEAVLRVSSSSCWALTDVVLFLPFGRQCCLPLLPWKSLRQCHPWVLMSMNQLA